MLTRFFHPWARLRLLTAGAVDRLMTAAGLCAVLWAGFLWATAL